MSTRNAPWWIALIAWMGGSTYWHVCQVKELCDAPLTVATSMNSTIPPFRIVDGTRLDLLASGNFGFAKSGSEASLAAVRPALDSLAQYLRLHPTKRLTITGEYASAETNSSSYPDLGIARAEGIKSYLIGKGLADSLFITTSRLRETTEFPSDSMKGGIEFGFTQVIPTTVEGLANAEAYESVFKPMDLYFPSGGSDFIKTPANQIFMAEAKKYLATHSEKKLTLTGHTDSDGDDALNMKLSKNRANAVKKQFVKAGIAANQLNAVPMGESEPKESNDTPEGKQANRRVTITIQI